MVDDQNIEEAPAPAAKVKPAPQTRPTVLFQIYCYLNGGHVFILNYYTGPARNTARNYIISAIGAQMAYKDVGGDPDAPKALTLVDDGGFHLDLMLGQLCGLAYGVKEVKMEVPAQYDTTQ